MEEQPVPASSPVLSVSRKVAGSGAQPASKPGPGQRLMVRLHHLPRQQSSVLSPQSSARAVDRRLTTDDWSLPDCAKGSTPGSEPGGRSSSLRLAAIDPMRRVRVLHMDPVWWRHRRTQGSLDGLTDRSCDRRVNGSARQPATLEVGVRISPITPRVGGANG